MLTIQVAMAATIRNEIVIPPESQSLPLVEAKIEVAMLDQKEDYTPRISDNSSERSEILEQIAYCESRGQHYDENGDVLKGEKVPEDTGKWQINTRYHGVNALKKGLDITKEEDNKAYAEYLYDTQGTKPWRASSKCLLQNFGIVVK